MSMVVAELGKLPFIQLFLSHGCNLKCSYCSNPKRFDLGLPDQNFIADAALRRVVETVPRTHWYLSGGEPLLCPGIEEFVAELGARGHVVSFDTNLMLPPGRIEALFRRWGRAAIGFVNISHHVEQGVTLEAVLKRTAILKDLGVPHFVKAIAVPDHLAVVRENLARLFDAGVGTAVTILTGPWGERWFPQDYTREEGLALLELVTLKSHGLQLFSGIHSRGLPCRGGRDHLCWNMLDGREVLPCCHGAEQPVALSRTYVVTGDRAPTPCQLSQCQGDLMFVYGINGVWDESARFAEICSGPVRPLGAAAALAAVDELVARGIRLYDEEMYALIRGERDAGRAAPRVAKRLPVLVSPPGA